MSFLVFFIVSIAAVSAVWFVALRKKPAPSNSISGGGGSEWYTPDNKGDTVEQQDNNTLVS
jgi:hypothetical protein